MFSEETRIALHRALDEALESAGAETRSLQLQLAAAIAERDEAREKLGFAEGTAATLRSRVEELGGQADEWRDRANALHIEVEELKEACRQNEIIIARKNARLAEIAGEILQDQNTTDETSP